MSNPVAPALSPEEWKRGDPTAFNGYIDWETETVDVTGANFDGPLAPALIALANAALPDDDPRKITWEWVDRLRKWADFAESEIYHPLQLDPDEARAMADTLASYLPPRSS